MKEIYRYNNEGISWYMVTFYCYIFGTVSVCSEINQSTWKFNNNNIIKIQGGIWRENLLLNI